MIRRILILAIAVVALLAAPAAAQDYPLVGGDGETPAVGGDSGAPAPAVGGDSGAVLPSNVSRVAGSSLPQTGSDATIGLTQVGAALLMTGAVAVGVARRRRVRAFA